MAKKQEIPIKIPDDVLSGVYSNQMMVRHTREEFVLDFANLFPPQGVVTARVIVSPGHLKRMIGALRDNLSRYESRHGPIIEAEPPACPVPDLPIILTTLILVRLAISSSFRNFSVTSVISICSVFVTQFFAEVHNV